MTRRIDDDVLSAFLDGELSGADAADVAQAIAADPALKLKVERMRSADQALREAIPLPPTPIRDPLRTLILEAPPAAKAGKPLERMRRFAAPVGLALAAGLCGMMIGFGLAPGGPRPAGFDEPGFVAPGSVAAALDGALSAQPRADGISVFSTFVDRSGRSCRHFSVARQDTSGEGIACRAEGRWAMVAWDATASNRADAFETAGASAALDSVQAALGAGDPLSPAQEAARIRANWR